MGDRCRVYFGEHTPDRPTDQHLQAPESKKLFFISPPPSPPHGWETKDENPPNSLVLAEDLAKALSQLHARKAASTAVTEKKQVAEEEKEKEKDQLEKPAGRTRSGSVLLFKPEEDEGHMPSISVEDLTDGEDSQPQSPASPVPVNSVPTARPPVELMHDA